MMMASFLTMAGITAGKLAVDWHAWNEISWLALKFSIAVMCAAVAVKNLRR
jgi:hypothetical protein